MKKQKTRLIRVYDGECIDDPVDVLFMTNAPYEELVKTMSYMQSEMDYYAIEDDLPYLLRQKGYKCSVPEIDFFNWDNIHKDMEEITKEV